MELFTQNISTIHFNVKRQYVVALWGGIRLKSLKVLFLLLSFTPGGNVWGKMIEFLWKVEPPASPRSWGVPVKQNQVWQKTPLGLRERERPGLLGNTSNMPGKESSRFSGLIRPQAVDVYKLLKWDLKANLFMPAAKSNWAPSKPGRWWGNISNFVRI